MRLLYAYWRSSCHDRHSPGKPSVRPARHTRAWHTGAVTDSDTVTFRLPRTALIGVFGLLVCMTPVAFGAPGLQVLYVVPLACAIWLLRTRTVVGPDTVVVHRVLSSRQITWSDLQGLRVDARSRVWAVLRSGEEVGLPAVRARDLPLLAAASGGRLPDLLSAAGEQPAPGEQR
ncbi:MAG TPA: PH domain-containing protein [Pseudonocardiaceae bacterium]